MWLRARQEVMIEVYGVSSIRIVSYFIRISKRCVFFLVKIVLLHWPCNTTSSVIFYTFYINRPRVLDSKQISVSEDVLFLVQGRQKSRDFYFCVFRSKYKLVCRCRFQDNLHKYFVRWLCTHLDLKLFVVKRPKSYFNTCIFFLVSFCFLNL